MDIIINVLVVISALFSLSGFYFFYRIPYCKLSNHKKYPKISIIIPARNEENNIVKLLNSINNQTFKVDEIIVVNDHSTDNTKAISESLGAVVFDAKDLPDGWKGKPWACFQGADFANGEVLIFLDSDTTFEKNGLKKVIDTFLNFNNETAMSIAPYHKVEEYYEEFSSIFNVVMIGAMNAFTPASIKNADGLFGQSLIIKKDTYNKIGGHEVVKDKVLENVFLASFLLKQNVDIKCFGGKNTLSFRMYSDGFINLVNGWSKAFASGASRTSLVVLLQIIFWLNGGFIAAILIIYSFNLITLILYLLFAIQFYWMLNRIGSFKFITSILFPIYFLFYFIVFSRSLYYLKTGKKINWKERAV